MEADRSTPDPLVPTPEDDQIAIVDGTDQVDDDRLDTAVLAADDTGMLAGERTITLVELAQGESAAGDV